MDYVDIFRRAWDIGRKNLWVYAVSLGFIVISFVFNLPGTLADAMPDQGLALAFQCLNMILSLAIIPVSLLFNGAMVVTAYRANRGQQVSIDEAFAQAWKRLGALLLIFLVIFIPLIFFVCLGIVAMSFVIGSSSYTTDFDPAALTDTAIAPYLCLFALIFLPIVFVLGWWSSFANNLALIDEMGPLEALGEGWRRFTRHIGAVLVLVIALIIVSLLFVGTLTACFLMLVGVAAQISPPLALVASILLLLALLPVNVLYQALQPLFITLFYLDLDPTHDPAGPITPAPGQIDWVEPPASKAAEDPADAEESGADSEEPGESPAQPRE